MPGVLLCCLAHQALKGASWVLLCSSVSQGFDGPASLLFICQCWCVGREAMVVAPAPTHDSTVLPCSMAAWLSSTGISHHSLLPHIPSICLSKVNSSPRPGIAPQSLNYSSQPLCLPGDLCPCPGYVWLQQGLSDSHFTKWKSCHRSAVSLSALNISPLTHTIVLMWGLGPCFRSPSRKGQVQS